MSRGESPGWATGTRAVAMFLLAAAAVGLFVDFGSGSKFMTAMHPSSGEVVTVTSQGEEDAERSSRRIAWLMSFPNSGTTYTNLLVRIASGYNTATNYGAEYEAGSAGTGTPIFEDMPEGPYFIGDPDEAEYTRPEAGYILTKTQ